MFKSTSATQQTIATGGKTLPNITWQGVGSSYLCSDAINTGATAVLTLTNGILDLNGKSHSVGLFSITGASARTLTFNAAAITIKGIGNAWNATTTTNLTFTPDTGSITMTGNGSVLGACNFIGGGLTYNTVAFTNTGISNLQSANTFATLTFTGGASASTEYRVSANQTISGTLTLNGTTVAQRAVIRSNTLGTQRTLTAATVSSNGFFDLMDIIGADYWRKVLAFGRNDRLLSEMEDGLLSVAANFDTTGRIPSDKQAKLIMQIRNRLFEEGLSRTLV